MPRTGDGGLFWRKLMKTWAVSASVLLMTTVSSFPQDVSVISQSNVAGPLNKLVSMFEKQAGLKVSVSWGTPAVTLARLRNNEHSDVVIVSTTIYEAVVKEGYLNRDSSGPIARTRTGVGVAESEDQPVIPDMFAFKNF